MQYLKTKHSRIEEIKKNGYQLDFATVFESAFENYKKIALYAGLMLLVFSILITIIMMTGLISYIGIEHLEEFAKKMKQFIDLKMMPLDIAIPLYSGILIFSCFINPFMAGFLKMADCGEKGEEFHVSTMFSYYKSPYFFNIFISAFLIGLIATGLIMLLELAELSFIGNVTSSLISFITFLSIPLIIFGNLNATEAIKSSIMIVSKQPLIILGLIIVAVIGGVIGIFGLCIGIFFTLPFIYSMNYIIYKHIVGIDNPSEIDEKLITKN